MGGACGAISARGPPSTPGGLAGIAFVGPIAVLIVIPTAAGEAPALRAPILFVAPIFVLIAVVLVVVVLPVAPAGGRS